MFHFLIVVLLSLFTSALATKLERHSFSPPFEAVNAKGTRIVNEWWETSGVSTVNNNFIRLTPDRQSKKGAIWSKKALGVDEFSATFKFRISGQGEKFFGDGLALWITHAKRHFDGSLLGTEEQFTGLGIIFDTFKNTERLAAHRDVLVLVNNDDKTFDQMTADVDKIQGCNVNVRYHEKRDDFSVAQSSLAKIIITDGESLKIQIDEHNTGEWFDCVTIDNLGLPVDWLVEAHVGMSASTGQLADNHDIISFESYSNHLVMEKDQVEKLKKGDLDFLENGAEVEDNIELLSVAVSDLLSRMEILEHEAEHKSLAVNDEIKSLLSKIEAKAKTNDVKIEDLDAQIKSFIYDHLDTELQDKLDDLEENVHSKVDRQLFNVEKKFDKNMNIKHQKLEEASKGSGSWKLPFFFLLVLIIVSAGAMYAFYQKIKKMHLL
jgi:mannose-binding lectin 2